MRILILLYTSLFPATVLAQTYSCPPSPSQVAGRDFTGSRSLDHPNFSHQNLVNANFSGVTLIAPYFGSADLTGANFTGAHFQADPKVPFSGIDFSDANLQSTCFLNATFEANTFLTRAKLTCTDFSGENLDGTKLVFGPDPAQVDTSLGDCSAKANFKGRMRLRGRTLSCELVSQWRLLDLSGADLTGCLNSVAPNADFSQAKLAAVRWQGANLPGVNFTNSDLQGALLTSAYLAGANFTNAKLSSTHFDKANLSGASFYQATLSSDQEYGYDSAASLSQAHLKNANLAYAHLEGVDFQLANFYGDNATALVACKTAPSANQCSTPNSGNDLSGFACHCATAANAYIYDTNFEGAFLAGADFTSAQMQGANFQESVLVGARFTNATMTSNPQSSAQVDFSRAYLQGANLAEATIKDAIKLQDAFVDFSNPQTGNLLYVLLNGLNHNSFSCGENPNNCTPSTGDNVCVLVVYPAPTTVPDQGKASCPSGNTPCPPPSGNSVNPNWASTLIIDQPPPGVPSGWYVYASTFTNAAPMSQVCAGQGPNNAVSPW